jgi:hypothetical protein
LLALLEHDEISWFDKLAATFADLNIKEGLPVLKRKLEKLQAHQKKDLRTQSAIIEVREAIQVLKGDLKRDLDSIRPLSLKRGGSWQDDLKQKEQYFYDKEEQINDFDFSNFVDYKSTDAPPWPLFTNQPPLVKEKTPGRNDPCPCGSGKKYKKCCMDKDG